MLQAGSATAASIVAYKSRCPTENKDADGTAERGAVLYQFPRGLSKTGHSYK